MIKEPEIKFLRLVTGEDIIGLIQEIPKDDFDEWHYRIQDPMKIVYLSNPIAPTRMSISLMQWIFSRICTEQMFKIYTNEVLTVGIPSASIIEYYNEALDRIDRHEEVIDDNTTIDEDELIESIKDYFKKDTETVH